MAGIDFNNNAYILNLRKQVIANLEANGRRNQSISMDEAISIFDAADSRTRFGNINEVIGNSDGILDASEASKVDNSNISIDGVNLPELTRILTGSFKAYEEDGTKYYGYIHDGMISNSTASLLLNNDNDQTTRILKDGNGNAYTQQAKGISKDAFKEIMKLDGNNDNLSTEDILMYDEIVKKEQDLIKEKGTTVQLDEVLNLDSDAFNQLDNADNNNNLKNGFITEKNQYSRNDIVLAGVNEDNQKIYNALFKEYSDQRYASSRYTMGTKLFEHLAGDDNRINKEEFEKLDMNNDGKISDDEIAQMKQIAEETSKKTYEHLDNADNTYDGNISEHSYNVMDGTPTANLSDDDKNVYNALFDIDTASKSVDKAVGTKLFKYLAGDDNKISPQELHKMDSNKDRKISTTEINEMKTKAEQANQTTTAATSATPASTTTSTTSTSSNSSTNDTTNFLTSIFSLGNSNSGFNMQNFFQMIIQMLFQSFFKF